MDTICGGGHEHNVLVESCSPSYNIYTMIYMIMYYRALPMYPTKGELAGAMFFKF